MVMEQITLKYGMSPLKYASLDKGLFWTMSQEAEDTGDIQKTDKKFIYNGNLYK